MNKIQYHIMKKGKTLLHRFLLSIFLIGISIGAFSQNMSINNNGAAPDNSAMLDVQSTSQGLLIPRMTQAQRQAIANPAYGLMVVQTDNSEGLYIFDTVGAGLWRHVLDSIGIANMIAAQSGGDTTRIADADNDTKIQVEESNDEDVIRFDIEGTEFFRMDSGRIEVVNTGGNIFIGDNAGESDPLNNNSNVGIGQNALQNNTTGESNVAIGTASLNSLVDGYHNVSIGRQSLENNTSGGSNTAVGRSAGRNNVVGDSNIFLGFQAGRDETGSQKLYIDNNSTSTPLIYGDLAADSLVFHGRLTLDSAKDGSGYTFPGADGTSGQVMQTDGSGNVTWEDAGGGGDTLGNHQMTQNLETGGNFISNDGDNEGLSISTGGTVTATPSTTGAGNIGFRAQGDIWTDGQGTGVYFTNSAIGITGNNGNSGDMRLKTGSSDRVTITSGGQVGIGTTSPTRLLDVGGIAEIDSLRINNSYGLPKTDGTAGYVLQTDGSGHVTWETPSTIDLGDTTQIADLDGDTKIQVEESADEDIIRFDMAGTEFFRMDSGRIEVLNTGGNIFLGENAGNSTPFSSDRNIGIGSDALSSNSTGEYNIGIGQNAINSNVNGDGNTAVGDFALNALTSGGGNVAMGIGALKNLPSGGNNIAIGSEALRTGNSGSDNIAIGRLSGVDCDAISQNIFIGSGSGGHATGNDNVVIGYDAGSTGIVSNNVFIGRQAGDNNTGSSNVFLGHDAGRSSGSTSNQLYIENSNSSTPLIWGDFANDSVKIYGNLSVGDEFSFPSTDGTNGQVLTSDGAGNVTWENAGGSSVDTTRIADADNDTKIQVEETNDEDVIRFDVAGTEYYTLGDSGRIEILNTGRSIFIGENAGSQDDLSNNSNTYIGYQAGMNESIGSDNLYIGTRAGETSDGAAGNVLVGSDAGQQMTTGSLNVIMGSDAARNSQDIHDNVIIGAAAGEDNQGNNNVFIGSTAGFQNTIGSENVALGTWSNSNNLEGNQNVILGYEAGRGSTLHSKTGNIFLGYQAGYSDTTDNKLYIENSNSSRPLIWGDFADDSLRIHGRLTLDSAAGNDYTFPGTRGYNGQVLTSDGAGNVTWENASGGNTLDGAYDQGGSGAGRTITADNGAVRVAGTDGIMVTGTVGSGSNVGVTGAGARMFYNPKSAAFRAGRVSGTDWDQSNLGTTSIGLGYDTEASGTNSVSIGSTTTATGNTSIAIGNQTTASASNATAIGGISTTASAIGAIAIGSQSTASGNYSTALGFGVLSKSQGEVAVGVNSTDYTPNSTSSFNAADRVFTVGNGVNLSNRSDAFIIYKSGNANLNGQLTLSNGTDSITLPNIDGTNGQVLTTNGSGAVTWEDPSGIQDELADGDSDTKILVDSAGADDDIIRFQSAGTEYFTMDDGHIGVINTGNSIYIGEEAGQSDDFSDNRNIGIGRQALQDNTTGEHNTAVGYQALESNATGVDNLAVGYNALAVATGDDNTAVGSLALQSTTTGENNTAIGQEAMSLNTTGNRNTAIGSSALAKSDTASYNTAIGSLSMFDNTEGEYNTSVGTYTLEENTTGDYNTAIGFDAMEDNTTGEQNTAIGADALANMVSGYRNTALGMEAGANNNGDFNTMIGHGAGENNTTGSDNVYIGYHAGQDATGSDELWIDNSDTAKPLIFGDFDADELSIYGTLTLDSTTGESYTFPGTRGNNGQVLTTNGAGQLYWDNAGGGSVGDTTQIADADNDTKIQVEESNDEDLIRFDVGGSEVMRIHNFGRMQVSNAVNGLFIGSSAGSSIIAGGQNTFLGYEAGTSTTNNSNNTFVGYRAGYLSNAAGNTVVGATAGDALTSGARNTMLGQQAGSATNTGAENVFIGQNAGRINSSGANNVYVGTSAGDINTGSDNVFIGNSAGSGVASGSDLLFITNSSDDTPLVYGDFAADSLVFNGRLTLDSAQDGSGYTFPGADGSNGQVLTTDGSGNVSWENAGNSSSGLFELNGTVVRDTGGYATHDFVFGSPQLDDDGNASNDSRMFFDKSESAFRAGSVTATDWNSANIGQYSFAGGYENIASGDGAVAFGAQNEATGYMSVTLGLNNEAATDRSVAIGNNNAITGGLWPLALGTQNQITGNYGVAIGRANDADAQYATAIGFTNAANSVLSTAIGAYNTADADRTMAMGYSSVANGMGSNAIGYYTEAESHAEIALGMYNTTYTPQSTTVFDSLDRILVVGNGTNTGASRHDALTILKSGNTYINGELTLSNGTDSITFPNEDGTNGQVLTTDGSGNLSWGAAGSDNDWTVSGGIVYNEDERFAMGTSSIPGSYYSEFQSPSGSTYAAGLSVDHNYTGAAQAFGLIVDVASTSTGQKYGIYNSVNSNGSQANPTYGTLNRMSVNGSAKAYGSYSQILGSTSDTTYGYYATGEDMNYFSGDVGIGTTAPTTKLEVNLTENNDGLTLRNSVGNNTYLRIYEGGSTVAASMYYLGTTDDLYFGTTNAADDFHLRTNGTERITIQQDGDVGIGTTTPLSNLHVDNGSATSVTLRLTHTGTASNGLWLQSNNTSASILNYEDTDLTFGTDGATRMTIENDGDVGIGTTSPSSKLDVNGDIETGSSDAFYFGDPNTNGTWRITRSGNNLVFERRESGSWNTKTSMVP